MGIRLLLINPKFPESFWGFSWAFDNVIQSKRAANPPLGLATLAALTPPDWTVTIVDENIEPIDWTIDADLVGVCGMSVQFTRQRQILEEFRARSVPVVAGGSFASLCPEKFAGIVGTVICGEAEYLWPRFCKDFAEHCAQALYREEGDVALTDSPVPRFDLLKWDRYLTGSIQFSRGCPFQCEFCDIIVTFGRKPRTKSLHQIEQELDLLRSLGVRNIVFVDDNLIGHLPQLRKLLRFLIEYQERHQFSFFFGCELSVNVVKYEEILRDFRAAQFAWFFMGIESPDEAALLETRKVQNTGIDLLLAVRKVYAHGIDVLGGFIIGFDSDDRQAFDRHFQFIVESGIVVAMVGALYAPAKTPLRNRLEREGRLLPEVSEEITLINAGAGTNVVPLRMTTEELVEGCRALHVRLLDDRAIYLRIRQKLAHMRNPHTYAFEPLEWVPIFAKLLCRGILPGGAPLCGYFLLTLLQSIARPMEMSRLLRACVASWVHALSLRHSLKHYARYCRTQDAIGPFDLLGNHTSSSNKLASHSAVSSRVTIPRDRGPQVMDETMILGKHDVSLKATPKDLGIEMARTASVRRVWQIVKRVSEQKQRDK